MFSILLLKIGEKGDSGEKGDVGPRGLQGLSGEILTNLQFSEKVF